MAGGASGGLLDRAPFARGQASVQVNSDASYTRLAVLGKGLIDPLDVNAYRMRLALAGSTTWALGAGYLTPTLEGERREAQARVPDYGAVLRGSVSF